MRIKTVDAARGWTGLTFTNYNLKSEHFRYDVYDTPDSITDLFNKYLAEKPNGEVAVAATTTSNGIGVGAIKFLLAPEMTASLARNVEPSFI